MTYKSSVAVPAAERKTLAVSLVNVPPVAGVAALTLFLSAEEFEEEAPSVVLPNVAIH